MLKQYLKQAPTMIVIGVTGLAAWQALFPEGGSPPPKGTSQPPSTAKGSFLVVGASERDPFQVARPPGAKAILAANSSSSSGPAAAASVAKKPAALPTISADEDQVLSKMKLGGTHITGREKLVIINDKVYTRGDQLREADGSLLPYVISEIRKDHTVLRRGRRDFVLGFSSVAGTGTPRVEALAVAKAETPSNTQLAPQPEIGSRKKGPSPSNQPGGNTSDPASMLRQLLSGLGGTSGGGAGLNPSALAGLLGGASGANLGSAGSTPINQNTIQAGLDALSGKYDNIGRSGDTSGESTP
jgi:hypothetical protein